jgi:prephenate dehydrogenase
MGSTKAQIVRAMDALPAHLRAVGSHPMCGKEAAGIRAAEAGLFRTRRHCPRCARWPSASARCRG